MRHSLLFSLMVIFLSSGYSQSPGGKVKIGVAGLTHGHVHWILQRMTGENYEVVGISESNKDLADRLFDQYELPEALWHKDIEAMVETARPDAVVAFNSIYEHLEVVEACAPMGIHVMVEKPLAVNKAHAQRMAEMAVRNDILLLTNYETTWYGTTREVMEEILTYGRVGEVRKVVVRDGHMGPQEIGVSKEFLEWLTDPVMNGGGALIDFGCYGANLITKLMRNERPLSVTAVTQQIKPHIYADVDDEATIILAYPGAQGIIQASWNWPIHRKDMDIYGTQGIIRQNNGHDMEIRTGTEHDTRTVDMSEPPFNDPFLYFAAAVQGRITIRPDDLSSLENNLIVVEILDAAGRSASRKETIFLK